MKRRSLFRSLAAVIVAPLAVVARPRGYLEAKLLAVWAMADEISAMPDRLKIDEWKDLDADWTAEDLRRAMDAGVPIITEHSPKLD